MTKPLEQDRGQSRQFNEDRLVIATHNQGKMRELKEYFGHMAVSVMSAADMNLPEPEETEDSFIGNALLKARAAAQESGLVCLADDSGLAVDGLDGAPGIYSARWAEQPDGTRDFYKGMDRIKRELGETSNLRAKFVCAIAVVWPDGHEEVVEGYAHGHLVFPPRGDQGFGYDPIFIPEGHDRTFGEMPYEEKEKLSHRHDAMAKILNKCFR